MNTGQASERDIGLAALRRDEALRQLLRIHLQGADPAPDAAARMADGCVPALLAAYRDVDSLRHDYPLVLFDDTPERAMATLAGMVDEMLREADARGAADDELRRQVYRLEADVKRALGASRERGLAALWGAAAQHLSGALASGGPLERDGRLVGCGPDTARVVVEHLWRALRAESARAERGGLDDLSRRLSEILDADRAASQRAASAAALRDAMAGEHAAGIDFEALAGVLRTGRQHAPLPGSRRRRVRAALKTIDAARSRLCGHGANGATRPRSAPRVAPSTSPTDALGRARDALGDRVELARAVRVARLELDNRYREQRHDEYFAAFGAGQLTPEESRALPAQLACIDADALGEAERLALLDALVSGLPVKVLLELRELPSDVAHLGDPGTPAPWIDRVASLAMSLGEAFVLQGTVSQLPQLAAQLIDGLRYPGPALFCIYAPASGGDEEPSAYLRAAAAAESRAMPGFVYDPSRGADTASRFALAGNPQPDAAWPRNAFVYEDENGAEARLQPAFTVVDFMALDARLRAYFSVVPPQRWHSGMVPIADYLELAPEQAASRVPYVHLVDAGDRLQRAIVKRELIAEARRCASRWRELQELAGIGSAHALRLLAVQRQQLEAEHRQAIEALRAGAGAAGAPLAAQPRDSAPGGESVAAQTTGAGEVAARTEAAAGIEPEPGPEPAPSRDRDEAWIDSELCTSCDDCIRRNPRAFAYDESKQAYVKDAAAASYRELVEAAEDCPVCIIHPGKPLDPDEPGLEELKKRAEPFV